VYQRVPHGWSALGYLANWPTCALNSNYGICRPRNVCFPQIDTNSPRRSRYQGTRIVFAVISLVDFCERIAEIFISRPKPFAAGQSIRSDEIPQNCEFSRRTKELGSRERKTRPLRDITFLQFLREFERRASDGKWKAAWKKARGCNLAIAVITFMFHASVAGRIAASDD